MSAIKMIRKVQDSGGRVTSFSSVCGGLPAPEAANNPFGYKFSWSPRGALSAASNPAQYKVEGDIVKVDGPALLSAARRLYVE
jgi:alpha-aminoadipic semialdehyde synthase